MACPAISSTRTIGDRRDEHVRASDTGLQVVVTPPKSRNSGPSSHLTGVRRWIEAKSTAKLADDLVRQGFKITDDTVGRILKNLSYSLQAPVKEKEGTAHPDRDAQFSYLNDRVSEFMKAGEPVISVDTKKKLRHEVAPSERARRSEARPMPEA